MNYAILDDGRKVIVDPTRNQTRWVGDKEFFVDPGNSWIAVPALDALGSRHYGHGGIEVLPDVSVDDAVVYRFGDAPEL